MEQPLPPLPPLPDLADGPVRLPALSDEELTALEDTPALRDAPPETSWAALDPPARRPLATRADPRFLGAADELGGDGHRLLLVHGVDTRDQNHDGNQNADRDRDGDVVLLEATVGGVHHFLPTPARDGAARLAVWALTPREDVEVVTRVVEVLRPAPDGPVHTRALVLAAHTRVLVLAAHGLARLATLDQTDDPGAPVPVTTRSLVTWLHHAWTSPR